MNVFLAKNLKSQIEEIPLKSVKELDRLIKNMKNNTFNSSASRTVSIDGNQIKEVRVHHLDVYYHIKGDNIFIVSISSNI